MVALNIPTGTEVTVVFKSSTGKGVGRKKERRTGRILKYYDKFVCVWIYAKANKDKGWRECFLYQDINNGFIEIEAKKTASQLDYVSETKSDDIQYSMPALF